MSTHAAAPEERARRFIDEVMQVNRAFGMDGDVSENVYNEAVTEATQAFEGLGLRTTED